MESGVSVRLSTVRLSTVCCLSIWVNVSFESELSADELRAMTVKQIKALVVKITQEMKANEEAMARCER